MERTKERKRLLRPLAGPGDAAQRRWAKAQSALKTCNYRNLFPYECITRATGTRRFRRGRRGCEHNTARSGERIRSFLVVYPVENRHANCGGADGAKPVRSCLRVTICKTTP